MLISLNLFNYNYLLTLSTTPTIITTNILFIFLYKFDKEVIHIEDNL